MCVRCENEPIEWQLARAFRDSGYEVKFDEVTTENIRKYKEAMGKSNDKR